MTTFTSDDREEAYKKIVEAAPNQPGYEDAVPIPFAGWVEMDNKSANQLASELENTMRHRDETVFTQAATMLRQQQAEIERLIGAEPITYGMLTVCKNCGQQNPYFAKAQEK